MNSDLIQKIYNEIVLQWSYWHETVGKPNCYIIGISGGVDSTTVAALACRIFGKENVVGVSLPCDGQSDMDDVNLVFNHLGIKRVTIDIGDAFASIKNKIENNCIELTNVCKTNMPARLRMTTLYGVAQCLGGMVLNTCNRSESVLGNDTLFGDDCGSYAPIQRLTKNEVIQLALFLGIPEKLAKKTPVDGLQPLSDEDRMGVKYVDVDNVIRGVGNVDNDVVKKIVNMYNKNKFKLDTVHIIGPKFNFLYDSFCEF